MMVQAPGCIGGMDTVFGGSVYRVAPGQLPEQVLIELCNRLAPRGALHTVYLVAPSSQCALHVRRRLALQRGVAGIETMPLARLAAVLADSSRPVQSTADGCAAVCQVLRDPPGLLAPHAQHDQARSAVWRAFRALRRMPQELLDALRVEPSRGAHLLQLYQSFRGLVGVLADEEDLYDMAAERVLAWKDTDTPPSVVFYLPRRVTPGATRLLRALAERGALHTVTLADDADVEEVLPETRHQPVSSMSELRIVRAHDPYDEVTAALSCIHLLVERHIPLSQIAILTPPATPSAPVADRCLAAGLPVFCPSYARLDESLPARLLLEALAAADAPVDADGWRSWLIQVPGVNVSAFETVLGDLDDSMHAQELAERLMQGRLERIPGEASTTVDLCHLLNLDFWRLERRSPADWGLVCKELIDGCLPDGHPYIDAVHRCVERASMCDLAAMSRSEWRWVLQQEFNQTVVPSGRAGEGVFVGTLSQARGIGFEYAWLMNVVEGELPVRPEMSPLMPELEPLLQWRREEAAQTRQDLRERLAISSCTLSFSLGRPVSGQVLFPSPWLVDIASALNRQPVSASDLMQMRPCAWLRHTDGMITDRHAERPWSAASFRLHRLWGCQGDRVALQAHRLVREDESLQRALSLHAARTGADPEWLGTGLPALALEGVSSASNVQMWAECPMRYALHCELGLPMPVEPDPYGRVRAVDLGSVIHALMRRWGMAQLDGRPVSPAQMLSWVDEELARLPRSLSIWREADREKVLLIFRKLAGFEKQHISGRVNAVEWSFELGKTDLNPMAVKGRIDRMDRDDTGTCVVTDYKTGRNLTQKQFEQDCVVAGKKLQPALYCLAVERLANTVAPQFRYVLPGDLDKTECKVISWKWDDSSKQRSREVLQLIAAGWRRGEYPMNPGEDQSHCRQCCFTDVCPVDRQRWKRHAWKRVDLFEACMSLDAVASAIDGGQDE